MTVMVPLINLSSGCARRMALREDTVLQAPPQSGTRSLYDALSRHGDMAAHHFDGGVPWDEALKESPYHFRVRSEIEYRRTHTPENKSVYLAVPHLSIKRNGLAGRWGKGTNLPRAGEWKQKNFSDPEVVRAYTNYCREMIRGFEPDFMACGIEVNMLAVLSADRLFAVSETGFIAEKLLLKIPGDERNQAEYVRFFLEQCGRLNARFVVWFFVRDYDDFWIRVRQSGGDELFMVWKDTGLLDERGNEREAMKVWERFAMPAERIRVLVRNLGQLPIVVITDSEEVLWKISKRLFIYHNCHIPYTRKRSYEQSKNRA